MDRFAKNLDRIKECSKQSAERKKLIEGSLKDVDRIGNDIRNLQYELKRLPKDKEEEFSDRVASLKARLTKLEKRVKSHDKASSNNM
jgi:phage host-nuclease inhibitor protein Gam